jgi:hypothetical protein
MRFVYTRHQVPRGSRPDAVTRDKTYLIKKVKRLRATYQIRLLAFEASAKSRVLVLKVPEECVFDRTLNELIRKMPSTIKREPL